MQRIVKSKRHTEAFALPQNLVRKGMQTAFEEKLSALNLEQRCAVDTIEGPVMVVAGPGTGKTQVLALRIANILQRTQANPRDILCLTFSTAGATAMRDRLRALIGADAYGVSVNTVHGFCDAIISRNAGVFSDWSRKKVLSDVERYRIIQSILDEKSGSSALINPKHPYERSSAIIGRISDCKREGKTLSDLFSVAAAYDEVMGKKSREGTKVHAKNLVQAQKFREFVAIFKRYQEILEERDLYDYDDMITEVHTALCHEDWLLESLQVRYQYILVDEAQDLNGAQWGILRLLTTYENVPHEPNIFIVGDDDQAIYRFQGANVSHMMTFRNRFPKAPIVVLTKNYRSTQPILDAAGKLIEHNEDRLVRKIPELHKVLVAATLEAGTAPVLLRPPSDSAEPWFIADLIEERLARGIALNDIAILVQTNDELRPIYDVLVARKIPVILGGKSDLLSHPVVMQVVQMLRSVASEKETALAHALACECLHCHPADIARLLAAARSQNISLSQVLLDLEASSEPYIDRNALVKARDLVLDWRQKHASRTVLQTLECVLRESGIGSSAHTFDPLDLAVIEAFFHYTKARCLSEPSLSLEAFLQDLHFYADKEYRDVRLTYQLPHLVSSGVQLCTAHQSKGLEFHTVILSSFREGHWDDRHNPSRLSLPEDLLFGWESEEKRLEKHEDERRVTYVAMTRAKRELLLLCPKEFSVGERARTVTPSAFFAEAGPLPEQDALLRHPEESSLLLLNPPRKIDAELQAYIRERLETFALSPSSLTTFLKSPQDFLRLHLLGQPEEITENSLRSLGYGSAVHWALRSWAEAKHHTRTFGVSELLQAFRWYLEHKCILTAKQQSDLFAQGEKALPRYFEQCLQQQSPNIYAFERGYKAHIGDVPMKGNIDRIDRVSPLSSDVVVIDYKTGRPASPSVIRGGMDPGKISWEGEGANFRQLVFYALLLEKAEPMLTPKVFVLECIGEREEGPVSRTFSITDAEKEDLRSLLRAVWQKITALDFTPLRRDGT